MIFGSMHERYILYVKVICNVVIMMLLSIYVEMDSGVTCTPRYAVTEARMERSKWRNCAVFQTCSQIKSVTRYSTVRLGCVYLKNSD